MSCRHPASAKTIISHEYTRIHTNVLFVFVRTTVSRFLFVGPAVLPASRLSRRPSLAVRTSRPEGRSASITVRTTQPRSPRTAQSHPSTLMDSMLLGRSGAQLLSGIPSTWCGYEIPAIHQTSENPPIAPVSPAVNPSLCTQLLRNPIASDNPSTGIGE